MLAMAVLGMVCAPLARADDKKVTLKVNGMTCAACSTSVEKALKGVSGVKEAKVHLDKSQADVTYDHAKVKPNKLIAAVKKAGFKAEQATVYKCEVCGHTDDKPGKCCGAPTRKVE